MNQLTKQQFTAKYLKKILATTASNYEHTARCLARGIIIDPIQPISKETADMLIVLYGLDLANANATFYKTFADRENKDWAEVVLDRLIHYATTYGGLAEFFGGVYIPNSPEQIAVDTFSTLTRIEIVSLDTLKESLQSLINQPIALPSEDIPQLASLVDEFGLNVDTIQNKELLIQLASEYNVVPKDPQMLLRVLVFLCTASTQLIKNKRLYRRLYNMSYKENPKKEHRIKEVVQSYIQMYGAQALADHYRPNKKLWLTLRKMGLQREVNHIKRLSDRKHVSHETFTILEKEQDLSRFSIYQLIKVYNYICEQKALPAEYIQAYRIRDGRVFVTQKLKRPYSDETIEKALTAITNELRSRFAEKELKFYNPDTHIDIKMPTSAKSFIGQYPMYTSIQTDNAFQVGIYWDTQMDLDLHAHSTNGDHCGYYKESLKGCVHTGDMTRLNKNNQAAEAIKVTNVHDATFSINLFSGNTANYKLYIAKQFDGDPTNVLADGQVIFQTQAKIEHNGDVFGTCIDDHFILANLKLGGRIPNHNQSELLVDAIKRKATTALNLTTFANIVGAQFVDTPTEATHNFSQENLSLDTFIDLFK